MTNDEKFMLHAIELGKQVKGHTGDNPYVGCVIVGAEMILGIGATQPPGKPHAEIRAFMDATKRGHSLIGATLYTTVEPCSFFGRTPPCTSAIIDQQIKRVVIGIRDPNPRVNGQGIRLLEDAGIEVTEGICSTAVRDYLIDWLDTYSCSSTSSIETFDAVSD